MGQLATQRETDSQESVHHERQGSAAAGGAAPQHVGTDRQVSERRLLAALKRVLKPLGLRGHLHMFRHALISRALGCGIPEAVVRDWVGHVDRDVMRLYTHIASSVSQDAMKRLAGKKVVTPASSA